ncbi:MAG: hypothetical protein JXR77_00830 [Lentisphaeria bacterium]|nr:hypothetical protein [Lentisphaeria bacterium]
MTANDVKIRTAVMIVLQRGGVVVRDLHLYVYQGSVDITGSFSIVHHGGRVPQAKQTDDTATALLQIERQVSRMREVTHLKMEFDNWEKLPSGAWVRRVAEVRRR